MLPTESAPEERRERRWRVLPPIPAGGESLSGLGVLEEIPGELGGLLWRSLRTVLLWAETPPRKRGGLFLPGSEEARLADLLCLFPESSIEAPLATLAEVLGAPGAVDARQVALACTRIAHWAQNRGARQTQWEFAHAAALACPADPRSALALGRAHRDRGAYRISEAWYKRAVVLARQTRDGDSYARGYIGLGKMWIARGSFPKAREALLKALRAAERDEELREVEGMAAHDLCAVGIECDSEEDVHEYAHAALTAYGQGHRLIPTLAHDIAFYWMKRGRFNEALTVFLSVVPRMPRQQQLIGFGNTARAAGASGHQAAFVSAQKRVQEADANSPRKADALLGVAQGALGLGLLAEGFAAAREAYAIAATRGESEVLLSAEGILQAAESEQAAAQNKLINLLSGQPNQMVENRAAERLAIDLVAHAEACATV